MSPPKCVDSYFGSKQAVEINTLQRKHKLVSTHLAPPTGQNEAQPFQPALELVTPDQP